MSNGRFNKVVWTDDMVSRFRSLRADGISLEACADFLGVSKPIVEEKGRELGLNRRVGAGRLSGAALEKKRRA